MVIPPNHDGKEAMVFAEKLRAGFEAHAFTIDNISVRRTISSGVALWPSHGSDFNSVLRAANQAEKIAKHEGHNFIKLSDQLAMQNERA